MLRIKPDVDLKELEKFGFIFCEYELYHLSFDEYNYINVYEYSREITFVCLNDERTKNLLFDLIQAGLVEKE